MELFLSVVAIVVVIGLFFYYVFDLKNLNKAVVEYKKITGNIDHKDKNIILVKDSPVKAIVTRKVRKKTKRNTVVDPTNVKSKKKKK